jgi:hypothetical protein
MFSAGSKLTLGLTTSAVAGFVVYGFLQNWGVLGVVGLGSAIVALAFLAGVVISTRDSDVAAANTAGLASAAAAQPSPGASLWPLVGGAGGAVLVVGLVTDRRWFVAGLVLLAIATVEWMVQAWSERASADPAYNRRVRGVLLHPLELPILAAVGLGALVFAFSRLMLKSSTTVGPVIFVAVASLITMFGFVFTARRMPSGRTIAGMCSVGAVAILAAGIWAGATGERAELALEGKVFKDQSGQPAERSLCGAEVNESDEHASGAVAAKSSMTAVVVLSGNTLHANEFGRAVDKVVIAKSNTVNLLFKNENGGDAELRLAASYLVTAVDSTGKPTSDLAKQVVCTNAIRSGKVQMLTITIPKVSAVAPANSPFKLYVPGLDGAEIQIEVQ